MLLGRPRDAFTMINVDHRSLERTVLEVHQDIETENIVTLHVFINRRITSEKASKGNIWNRREKPC
jgi:hypothetical protein